MSGSVNSIPAIPMSQIVNITPSVLSAGGAALDLNGLLLDNSGRIPIGQVWTFPSQASVAAFFGSSSAQAAFAANYFLGYDNSFKKPGALLIAPWYGTTTDFGWLHGGNISSLTLAQLQAISGTLSVVIDGITRTTASFNLADCNSFTDAAEKIGATIAEVEPVEASFEGYIVGTTLHVTTMTSGTLHIGQEIAGAGVSEETTIRSQISGIPAGGVGTYLVSISQTVASVGTPEAMTARVPEILGTQTAAFTAALSGSTLTVSAVASGRIAVGNEVHSANTPERILIVSQLTGTAGLTGTYSVSGSALSVSSEAMTTNIPLCTYDVTSGGFWFRSPTTNAATSSVSFMTGSMANSIKMASTTALISPGIAFVSATVIMDNIIKVTQDWASFATIFDADEIGETDLTDLVFAAWTNAQNNRYLYVVEDEDLTEGLGAALIAGNYSGTCPIYSPTLGAAVCGFIMGLVASLDFNRTNGRVTAAFRHQTGLTPDVTDPVVAATLNAQGYNFYGRYTTANQLFNWFYNGLVSGPFKWLDSYVNQIWLTNQFQLALANLLDAIGSIPYNQAGYALIRSAMLDPIIAAGNFGVFRPGVTLSQAQIAEVNFSAGVKIDDILQTTGWYLQVRDATPQVRAARGSPPITFWYMDGGSIQKIQVAAIMVQ